MSKRFRNCDLNQRWLLPASLEEWLPEGYLARFVAEVVEALDLSAIYARYEEREGRGLAAYDPRMMVRVLIYGGQKQSAYSGHFESACYHPFFTIPRGYQEIVLDHSRKIIELRRREKTF